MKCFTENILSFLKTKMREEEKEKNKKKNNIDFQKYLYPYQVKNLHQNEKDHRIYKTSTTIKIYQKTEDNQIYQKPS